ncbi:MAG: hypothetical protein WC830_23295 [Burkholderiales bacterium]
MSEDKLSAREAALIAQARAALQKKTPPSAPPARSEAAPVSAAPADASPASSADPAQRIAALMAAARAESERTRQRQRKLYVWAPLAFMSVLGLWTLLWLWHRL